MQPSCPVCSTPIERKSLNGPWPTYCGTSCRRTAAQQRARESGRYAATLERRRAQHVPTRYDKTCEHCSSAYVSRRIDQRFCSKACTTAANERRCSRPGCDKPHRAKGLCSTCYNQQLQPDRHKASATACTVCGDTVHRPRRADRRPVCSVGCRATLSGHEATGYGYSWRDDAARRARLAGATVIELFDREQVFDRDGWTCRHCGQDVSLEVDALDPRSATVDHVVPLSRGGEHTLGNAQCLCLMCNSIKSDRGEVTVSDRGPSTVGDVPPGAGGPIPPGRALAVRTPEFASVTIGGDSR